jgi:6-phosphogluconolactonase/glucosamine-6-phosphate isomerase/deaminase
VTIKAVLKRDFRHMSRVGADIVKKDIIRTLKQKKEFVLGLATGNSLKGIRVEGHFSERA